MSEDEALSEPFRLADAAFREFAEMTAANDGKAFEEAHQATWRLYELGDLKLMGEGDRLGVRACITRAERRAAAEQNRPLATYWRRTARWERERGSQLGSGLIDQSQKMTVAAMEMADMKVWAHRS